MKDYETQTPYHPAMATPRFIENVSAIFIFSVNCTQIFEVRMCDGAVLRPRGYLFDTAALHQDLMSRSKLVQVIKRTRLCINAFDIACLRFTFFALDVDLIVEMRSGDSYRVRHEPQLLGGDDVYEVFQRLREARQ